MRCSNLKRLGLALAGMTLGAGGCALEPGAPWGLIEPRLEAQLVLPEGRLDGEGRVRTVDDYRVVLDTLDVSVGSLTFVPGESAALAFDPAAPPEGYSLCHNGHCHADDGRLVDYAQVAAELAGGAGGGGAVLTLAGNVVALASAEAVSVGLEGCEGSCSVDEPVALAVARVVVTKITVAGRTFDSRVGDASRLPVDGQPFDTTADLSSAPVTLAVVLGQSFGPGRDAGLRVALGLEVSPSFLDGLPWPEAGTEPFDSAIGAALSESIILELGDVERFDP